MDESRRCTAKAKQTGERCKRAAIPGGHVCVMHGGAIPAVRAAAAKRKADAAATAALEVIWNPDAESVKDPVEALASLAGKLEHAVDVLGARVDATDLDGTTALAWARVMREYQKALVALQGLGLEERRVRLAEGAGAAVAGVLRTVLDQLFAIVVEAVGEREARELGLADVWNQSTREIVPAELRRLAVDQVVRGEVQ